MSKDIAIKIENLSKRYQLGHQKTGSLRHTMQYYWQRWTNKDKVMDETFWALRDLTFNVKRGEVLGIIGRNGAGKSTFLKILSRITPPTTGRIEINGRVASLLEIGTGFHPELSGRENIFMNGSLLGMTRREIQNRLDEIIDFSGVERFLDTPVKRYSSGMYVRLAFAVAVHLEPEILLIDEVLAVGDVAFQKKCLQKMNEVAQSGRTVIYVSHNMGAIEELCTRCGWIEQGILKMEGQPTKVIQSYLQSLKIIKNELTEHIKRQGNGSMIVDKISVQNEQNENVKFLRCGQHYRFVIVLKNTTSHVLKSGRLDIRFNRAGSQRIAWLSTWLHQANFSIPAHSSRQLTIHLPKFALMPGVYSLNLHLTNESGLADWVKDAIFLNVESGAFFPSRLLPPANQAYFLMDHHLEWE